MGRWYSPRGALRGLILAGVTAAIWIAWAVVYTHEVVKAPQPSATPTSSTPANVECCLRPRHLTSTSI